VRPRGRDWSTWYVWPIGKNTD